MQTRLLTTAALTVIVGCAGSLDHGSGGADGGARDGASTGAMDGSAASGDGGGTSTGSIIAIAVIALALVCGGVFLVMRRRTADDRE